MIACIIVKSFHKQVSKIGELFAVLYATRADETVSLVRRVSWPGLTLQGMLQPRTEDALPDPPDTFCKTLASHGRVIFMETEEDASASVRPWWVLCVRPWRLGFQRGA